MSTSDEDFNEDDFNEAESSGARAQLKIDLGENWTITPGIVYQEMDPDGVFDHGFFPLTNAHDLGCASCHTNGTYSGLNPACESWITSM